MVIGISFGVFSLGGIFCLAMFSCFLIYCWACNIGILGLNIMVMIDSLKWEMEWILVMFGIFVIVILIG